MSHIFFLVLIFALVSVHSVHLTQNRAQTQAEYIYIYIYIFSHRHQIQKYIYIYRSGNSAYRLDRNQQRCRGYEKYMGYKRNTDLCYNACENSGYTYFSFGRTKQFSTCKLFSNDCRCYCQVRKGRTCRYETETRYNSYKINDV